MSTPLSCTPCGREAASVRFRGSNLASGPGQGDWPQHRSRHGGRAWCAGRSQLARDVFCSIPLSSKARVPFILIERVCPGYRPITGYSELFFRFLATNPKSSAKKQPKKNFRALIMYINSMLQHDVRVDMGSHNRLARMLPRRYAQRPATEFLFIFCFVCCNMSVA